MLPCVFTQPLLACLTQQLFGEDRFSGWFFFANSEVMELLNSK